ncbi:hypothetical protein MRX96_001946 [Rhipicephalus microplus]
MFLPNKSETKPLHPSLKNSIDAITFENLFMWRSVRWERVVNATGLGTDANASDKLKQALQKPYEKNITAQAVQDILLLRELLDLTNWTTDKKWKAFRKGCQLLVTRETTAKLAIQDRQIMVSGWGPGIDPPKFIVAERVRKGLGV